MHGLTVGDEHNAPGIRMAQQAALQRLGRPPSHRTSQAILLDRGGDDWLWMYGIRLGVMEKMRVGALVFTPGQLAYGESVPAGRGLLGGTREVPWSWAITTPQIRSVDYLPVLTSVRGGYPVICVTDCSGDEMRFGIDWAEPSIDQFVCGLREMMGTLHVTTGTPSGSLRHDGAYVGAREPDGRWRVIHFGTDNQMVTGVVHDPHEYYLRICRKIGDLNRCAYTQTDSGSIGIQNYGSARVVEDRIILQPDCWTEHQDPFAPSIYMELIFLPDWALGQPWTNPNVPVTSRRGYAAIVNEGLVVKDFEKHDPSIALTAAAKEVLQNAMLEAQQGRDFRRLYGWDTLEVDGSWSDHSLDYDSARQKASLQHSAQLALITAGLHHGKPAAICDAYNFVDDISVRVVQPYRKVLLSVRRIGPQEVTGPAPPLPD